LAAMSPFLDMSFATLVSASAGTAVATLAYRRLVHPRLCGVRVQCWFCPSAPAVTVPYAQRNAWTCAVCGQYNGFAKDGGYNRDVANAAAEVPARIGVKIPKEANDNETVNNNGFCDTCNVNQSLKAHQLARFVPSSADAYDREVEAYAKHLEDAYRLCRRCEAVLHQTLGEQDSWLKPRLLTWRLEANRAPSGQNKGCGRQNAAAETWRLPRPCSGPLATLRLITAIFSLALVAMFSRSQALAPALVMCVLVPWFAATVVSCRAVFKLPNMLAVSMWVLIYVVTVYEQPRLIVAHLQKLVTACVALSVANAFRRPSRAAAVAAAGNGRMKPSQKATVQLSLTKHLSGLAGQPTQVNPAHIVDGNVSAYHLDDVDSTLAAEANAKDDCDISTLSLEDDEEDELRLSESPPGRASTASPTFSLRQYSPGSVDFRRPTASVLRPARFFPAAPSSPKNNGVVKASWVAGGYWQRAPELEPESVSRASSQSSGFISQSGSLNQQFPAADAEKPGMADELEISFCRANPFGQMPASKASSIAFDPLDRASVTSEVTAASMRRRQAASFSLDGTLANSSMAKPKAESSPLPTRMAPVEKTVSSWLEKRVHVQCSVSSILLLSSAALNVCLFVYFACPQTTSSETTATT